MIICNEKQTTHIHLFTDGACRGNPGDGGWGFVVLINDKLITKMNGYCNKTTNQRMELTAALNAICSCPESLTIEIGLYSDSSYLCNCMNQRWFDNWTKNGWKTSAGTPVANSDLWRNIIYECAKRNIKFMWVKGHADNKWNNMCDLLANQAIDDYLKL